MGPLPDRIKRGRFTSSRFSRHNLAVIARLDVLARRSSIPETAVIERRSRGVPGPPVRSGDDTEYAARRSFASLLATPPLSSPGSTGRSSIPERVVKTEKPRRTGSPGRTGDDAEYVARRSFASLLATPPLSSPGSTGRSSIPETVVKTEKPRRTGSPGQVGGRH